MTCPLPASRHPLARRLVWALLGLLAALPPAWAQKLDPAAVAQQVVARTNELRRARGLPATTVSAPLVRAAQGFADHMARTDRYGHEADGREPVDRARAAGYPDCIVAENIAWRVRSSGYDSARLAKGLFEGWRDSPAHRQNLLDADLSETGVAVARSARSGRWYGVQMFGRPQSQRIAFALANRAQRAVAYEVDGQRFRLAPQVTRRHEQCRPPRLALRGPGLAKPLVLAPRGGERLEVVSDAAGRLALRRGGG